MYIMYFQLCMRIMRHSYTLYSKDELAQHLSFMLNLLQKTSSLGMQMCKILHWFKHAYTDPASRPLTSTSFNFNSCLGSGLQNCNMHIIFQCRPVTYLAQP